MVPPRALRAGTPSWRRAPLAASAVLAALLAAGCGGDDAATGTVIDPAAQAAFDASQAGWRRERAGMLTQPGGWASLVGLHWVGPGPHYVGSSAGNGVQLSVGPSHLGMVDVRDGGIRLVPERGVPLTLDGEPLDGAVVLSTDAGAAAPSVVGFDDGRGRLAVIRRGTRHALRVWHADAATRTGFKAIEYWPGGTGWVVTGRYTPHPAPRTLEVTDIVGTLEQVANPGTIEFDRDGRTHRIEVLDPGLEGAAIAFVDGTSGHGSYGIGRYLDVDLPPSAGPVRLDFNRAYNPPCAFSKFSTCRLTPNANRLDLRVEAGEKAYVAPTTP